MELTKMSSDFKKTFTCMSWCLVLKACEILSKRQKLSEHLPETYCGIATDKSFLRDDWRLRPLLTEMMHYARFSSELRKENHVGSSTSYIYSLRLLDIQIWFVCNYMQKGLNLLRELWLQHLYIHACLSFYGDCAWENHSTGCIEPPFKAMLVLSLLEPPLMLRKFIALTREQGMQLFPVETWKVLPY